MSDVDVVTVSSRGQVSIPAEIRKDLGLERGNKLLVVSRGDSILFRKIDADIVEQSFEELLDPMWDRASDAGLDEVNGDELVQDHRRE